MRVPFSLGICTFGLAELKFGIEVHIYPWELIGYIRVRYPNPLVHRVLKTVSKRCISVIISLLNVDF